MAQLRAPHRRSPSRSGAADASLRYPRLRCHHVVVGPRGIVLWDFAGTLGEGPGSGSGSRALWEAISVCEPDLRCSLEAVRGFRRHFPWHAAVTAHPDLLSPEAWWSHVAIGIQTTLVGVGADPGLTTMVTSAMRERYGDATQYRIIDDATPALEELRRCGWQNCVLSNHGPELPSVIAQLRVGPWVDAVFSSALIGYEKPDPRAFEAALRLLGTKVGRSPVVMIGDDPVADIAGAARLGIPAVLVRQGSKGDDAPGVTLREATRVVITESEQQRGRQDQGTLPDTRSTPGRSRPVP